MTTPDKKVQLANRASIMVTTTNSPVTAFANDKDDDMYSVSEITSVKEEKQPSKSKSKKSENFAKVTLSKLPPELKRMESRKSSSSDHQNGQEEGMEDDVTDESSNASSTSDTVAVNNNIPSSFAVYAKTLFHCKTTHVYSCAALPQPLLLKEDKSDFLSSLACWVTILRIMGDLPDKNEDSDIAVQGEHPSVVSKVKGSYKIKYTKKEIEDAQRKYTELFKDPQGSTVKNIPFLYDGQETMLEKVQFICAMGIYRTELRDELYCQLCKQLSSNPSKNSTIRGWVMLHLMCGSFAPSEHFAACLKGFLKEGPRDLANKVDKILRRTASAGTRGFPPSWLEFQAAKNGKPILLPITFMNGQRILTEVDAATTVKELCKYLCQATNIAEDEGFSIYVSLHGKISCLGNGHLRIMDAISECEQHTRSMGMRESNSGWRLFFRKEFFSPWYKPLEDRNGTELVYQQIMRGISLGEYECEKESVLVLLAAQKYYLEHPGPIDGGKLDLMLRNWLPQDSKYKLTIFEWIEKVTEAIKNNFEDDKPKSEHLKIDIVSFAMEKWFLLFSRFYDVSKFLGSSLSFNTVVMAINSHGIHILDDTETLKASISYIEISDISKWRHSVTITTIKGENHVVTSQHADDMYCLLTLFLNGLKDRSKYAIVLQDTAEYGASDMTLSKGDLVVLDKPFVEYESTQVFNVSCPRTQKSGTLPADILYILPTSEEPKTGVMAMLTFQLKKDVTPFFQTEETKQHTLALFARYHFRTSNENAVSKLLSKASFKKEKSELLWQYTRDPMKKPLLKKSFTKEDVRNSSVRSFLAIQQYMGDAAVTDHRTVSESINENVIEQIARNRYLKEEIYCQIIKQLTNNPNKSSCDRGWQLMYFICGAATPSHEIQQQCTKFLSTSKHFMAKQCLKRLQGSLKNGCRLYPPRPEEYEIISNGQFTSPVAVLMPDGSKQIVAVSSDTKLLDIRRHIGTKLKLKHIEEFSLFITSPAGFYCLSTQDFYYDAISHAEIFLLRSKPDTPLPKTGLGIVMLRKLWVNATCDNDKEADVHFHYPQEVQSYLHGYQKCNDALIIQLAALVYRAKFGDNVSNFSNFEQIATSVIPRPLLSSSPATDWVQHISEEFKKSSGKSAVDAMIEFLKIAEKWPTYGSVFFEVKQRSSKSLPKEMILAVNSYGCHLINKANKELLVTHDFAKIPNWAYDENSITLIIQEGQDSKQILLETRLGHNIDDVIMSYISYIMNTKLKKKATFIGSGGESVC